MSQNLPDKYQFEKRDVIYDEIDREREYQNTQYGDEFDDKNTINDWVSCIAYCIGNARSSADPSEQREKMVHAATLCIAAVEAFDRNKKFPPRHYDV